MLRNQRGEGKLSCLVGLIVILVVALIAYKMIPVKVKAADFRDTIYDEAKSAGQHNDARIRKEILTKAEDLGFPVQEKDIKITRRAQTIYLDVSYTVPVEFPGYTYQWKFHQSVENPIF